MLRHRIAVISRGRPRFRVDERAIPHRHSVRTRDNETHSSQADIALESVGKSIYETPPRFGIEQPSFVLSLYDRDFADRLPAWPVLDLRRRTRSPSY